MEGQNSEVAGSALIITNLDTNSVDPDIGLVHRNIHKSKVTCLLHISDIPERELNRAHLSAHNVGESNCTVHESDASSCPRCSALAPELRLNTGKLQQATGTTAWRGRKCVMGYFEPCYITGSQ
jgi:hypothetical protein